jgi:lipopolysaccharide/colanic/teichoic acid biosynthesis glycosyltransferase
VIKRAIDIVGSLCGLLVTSPVIGMAAFAIWLQDRRSPFYIPDRIGQHGRIFRMVKLRSMVVGADTSGIDSTRAGDERITRVGAIVRRFKLDELPQLWNVLTGEMSLVGPRPQIARETRLYTAVERRLLDVRPGVTDFSSIVFADLAEILAGHADANLAYNQLVRPGKSRLGLFYIDHRTTSVDLTLIALTAVAIVSHRFALAGVRWLLERHGADPDLLDLAGRRRPRVPQPPPGADHRVTSRESGVPA